MKFVGREKNCVRVWQLPAVDIIRHTFQENIAGSRSCVADGRSVLSGVRSSNSEAAGASFPVAASEAGDEPRKPMQRPSAHIAAQGSKDSSIGATPSATNHGQPSAIPPPIRATTPRINPLLPPNQVGRYFAIPVPLEAASVDSWQHPGLGFVLILVIFQLCRSHQSHGFAISPSPNRWRASGKCLNVRAGMQHP